MATKKKRIMSAAQKAVLKKGQAALAAKRAGKKTTKKPAKKRATAIKTRKRTPAQRATRKARNTKPGYYPNPITTVYLVGAKSRVANKKGYFNGTKKLSDKRLAQNFDNFVVAKQVAANLAERFVQFQFFVETVKKKAA